MAHEASDAKPRAEELRKHADKLRSFRQEQLSHSTTILTVLGVEERETALVSALAWLLDPKGNHGLGDSVLRKFLKRANITDTESLGAVTIVTEVHRGSSRADLLLSGGGFMVLLEAKVNSPLGRGDDNGGTQLDRLAADFLEYTKRVFLTRDGLSTEGRHYKSGGAEWVGLKWSDLASALDSAALEGVKRHNVEQVKKAFTGLTHGAPLTEHQQMQADYFRTNKDDLTIVVDLKYEAKDWLRGDLPNEVAQVLAPDSEGPWTVDQRKDGSYAAEALWAWGATQECVKCWEACQCYVTLFISPDLLTHEQREGWEWWDEWPSVRVVVCQAHREKKLFAKLRGELVQFSPKGNSTQTLMCAMIPGAGETGRSFIHAAASRLCEGLTRMSSQVSEAGHICGGSEGTSFEAVTLSELKLEANPDLPWFLQNHTDAQVIVDAKFLASLAQKRE